MTAGFTTAASESTLSCALSHGMPIPLELSLLTTPSSYTLFSFISLDCALGLVSYHWRLIGLSSVSDDFATITERLSANMVFRSIQRDHQDSSIPYFLPILLPIPLSLSRINTTPMKTAESSKGLPRSLQSPSRTFLHPSKASRFLQRFRLSPRELGVRPQMARTMRLRMRSLSPLSRGLAALSSAPNGLQRQQPVHLQSKDSTPMSSHILI